MALASKVYGFRVVVTGFVDYAFGDVVSKPPRAGTDVVDRRGRRRIVSEATGEELA